MAEGILPAITLVNAGIVGRNFLRKPSSQKHRLSPACFLDVYDLPTSNGPSYQVPVLQTSTRHEDDVTSALDRLSEQEPNKIRVFINEFDEDGMTGHLFSRLQSAGPLHPQVSPGGRNSKSGIKALMSQWRGTRSDEWYRSDGWDYLTHEDMLDPRVRAQGPLKRQMSELRRDIKELAGLSDEQWVFTLKHYRVEDNNGCLRVFISNETKPYKRTIQPCISTERFTSELLELERVYQPLRTKENLKQMLFLQYHHANLALFIEFLGHISSKYARRRRKDIDPRKSRLRQWNLKAIMNDVELYRRFSSFGTELQSMIGLLSDLVLIAPDEERDSSQRIKTELSNLRAELSCCGKDVKVRLDKLTSDLEQDLKFLSMSRDITQSRDVQTLTLLATLFLPLSLSAGMLSMQYRFNELGDRLYDFIGIVVLLVAIVLVLLIVISAFNLGLELEGRFRKYEWYRQNVRPLAIAILAFMFVTMGLLTLASFIVGMFKDVRLGGKILGWGFLAAFGLPTALILVITLGTLLGTFLQKVYHGVRDALIYLIHGTTKKRRQQQNHKQQDPEDIRVQQNLELEEVAQGIKEPHSATPVKPPYEA